MSDRVLVEFTKETQDAADNVVREKGARVQVDAKSAKSFEKKGVAKTVSDQEQAAEAKKAAPPVTSPPGVS